MPEVSGRWPIHVYSYGEAYDDLRTAFFLDERDYTSPEAGRAAADEAAAVMRGTGVIYEETSYQDCTRSPGWLTWEQFKQRHFVDGLPLPVRPPVSRGSRPPGRDAMHQRMRSSDEALQEELGATFASCLPGSGLSFHALYGPMRRSKASIYLHEEQYGFEVRADIHGFDEEILNTLDTVSAELMSRGWQLGHVVARDDDLPPELDRYGIRGQERIYLSVGRRVIYVSVESRLYRESDAPGAGWVTEIRTAHPDDAPFYPDYVEPAPEPGVERATSTDADSADDLLGIDVKEATAAMDQQDQAPSERDKLGSQLPRVPSFAGAPHSWPEAFARLRVCEIHFSGPMPPAVLAQLMSLLELEPAAGGDAVILGTRELPVAGCRGRLQMHLGDAADRWHLDMRIDRLRAGVEPALGDDAAIAAEFADIARMIVTLLEHFGFLVWDLVARPKSLLTAIAFGARPMNESEYGYGVLTSSPHSPQTCRQSSRPPMLLRTRIPCPTQATVHQSRY